MDTKQLTQIIEQGMDTEHVSVTGDGRHFQALVVSQVFVGMSMIQQHKTVYRTLGDHFDSETVHALQLRTCTPQQWHDMSHASS